MEKPAEKRTVSITALFRRKAAKRYRCDKDLLDTLPNEIVAHIFTFLPIEEIGLLALVCKRFHHILQEDNEYFWKPLCNKWWHENGFHNHFTLEEVVNQAKEFQGRGWRWFAACFSHPCQEKEERDGLCWKRTTDVLDIGEFVKGDIKWGNRLWLTGKYTKQRYIGDFKGKQRTGTGIYTWPDGDTYYGEMKADKLCGNGVYVWSIGRYEGQFSNDLMNGKGLMKWKNGWQYEGEFAKSAPIDKEKSIHPLLKTALEDSVCTYSVTSDKPGYGQFLWECYTCNSHKWFCSVCKETCHEHDEHAWEEFWTFGEDHCECGEQKNGECVSMKPTHKHKRSDSEAEPSAKRQKVGS